MGDKELYSIKITKGSRTYFFDIKKSVKGELYLKVSESKKNKSEFERHTLIVFEEVINDFEDAFNESMKIFKESIESKELQPKRYSLEKLRESHKKAYLPWTEEEDKKLEILFCEGKKVKELTEIFGRNNGAINSRIKKLELKDKYS